MEDNNENLSQISPALQTSEKQGAEQKNASKITIIILAILALAGIGFGVYELFQTNSLKQQIANFKVEIKKDDGSTTTIETDKIEVREDNKTITITDLDGSIVTTALDKEQSTPWPEDIPREEYEPETVVNHVKIPKINLEASAAASINQKILDRYSRYVDGEQTYTKGPYTATVTYDYATRDKILFIVIKSIVSSYRAGGSAEYDVYYYDMAADQELTVADVASRFNITRPNASIILPSIADSFDVYYRDEGNCFDLGCRVIENTF